VEKDNVHEVHASDDASPHVESIRVVRADFIDEIPNANRANEFRGRDEEEKRNGLG
jgi:hypothetical protein